MHMAQTRGDRRLMTARSVGLIGGVLVIALLIAACATTETPAPAPPVAEPGKQVITISALPAGDYQPADDADPEALIRFALKVFPDDPGLAADYLVQAAALPFSRELTLTCLAGGARAALKAGDVPRFLDVAARLEARLTPYESMSPPPQWADVLALARLVRGERLPVALPDGVERLIRALEWPTGSRQRVQQ